MKVQLIISDEVSNFDNTFSLYEFILPAMRFPCTHTKSEILTHPKFNTQRCKSIELNLRNDERELLKHVFIHGFE